MALDLIVIFRGIVIFTALQRLAELFWAKRNEAIILKEGGFIVPEKNYLFMVMLHTSWLVGLIVISFFYQNSLTIAPSIFFTFFFIFILGQSLRLLAISTLGSRWSTRIVILPEAPVIKNGLFQFFRHPNYLGVCLELFALPFMASLWGYGVVFSLLNGVILYFRISYEEEMLSRFNNYSETFNLKVRGHES